MELSQGVFMIKIVSDSSTMYSIEEGQKNNIDIALLIVTINGTSYKEYKEINTEEFIDLINDGHVPISSQPAIGDVIEIYEKNKDYEIINLSMADGLSGTYNSACMAKNMVDNKDNIEVINTKTLCGPHRYLVDVANKMVALNKSKSEIIEEIEKLIETSKSYLIPNDFDYLVRGGRLSPLVGKIGGLIKLVPVMVTTEDGKRLDKFTTKRTFKKAIEEICGAMKKDGVNGDYKIYVAHSCREDLANTAKSVIVENIDEADIEIKKLGPVFTTQGGPGCIAIQFIRKHSILE